MKLEPPTAHPGEPYGFGGTVTVEGTDTRGGELNTEFGSEQEWFKLLSGVTGPGSSREGWVWFAGNGLC